LRERERARIEEIEAAEKAKMLKIEQQREKRALQREKEDGRERQEAAARSRAAREEEEREERRQSRVAKLKQNERDRMKARQETASSRGDRGASTGAGAGAVPIPFRGGSRSKDSPRDSVGELFSLSPPRNLPSAELNFTPAAGEGLGGKEDKEGMLLIPPMTLLGGRWKVIRELGRGAFAQVYLCRDNRDDSESGGYLAIKVAKSDPKATEEAHDEAGLLSMLQEHASFPEDCIVRLVGCGLLSGRVVIATEALHSNLAQELKRRRNANAGEATGLAVHDVRCIVRDIAQAIAFLHSLYYIHCDLKLDNVLFRMNPENQVGIPAGVRVKLIDFGSVRQWNPKRNNTAMVQTRSHRAPEVHLGYGWDPRIDVWSLGCIAAELFLGEYLLPSSSLQESCAVIGAVCGRFPLEMIPPHLNGYFEADGEPRELHDILSMQEAADPFYPAHLRERRRLEQIFPPKARTLATACSRMLAIDPRLRCSSEEALRLPFLS